VRAKGRRSPKWVFEFMGPHPAEVPIAENQQSPPANRPRKWGNFSPKMSVAWRPVRTPSFNPPASTPVRNPAFCLAFPLTLHLHASMPVYLYPQI
jgi:hypothetical protein